MSTRRQLARLTALDLADQIRADSGLSASAADRWLADRWPDIDGLDDATKSALPNLSMPSLRRWRLLRAEGQMTALKGRYHRGRHKHGCLDKDGPMRSAVCGIYNANKHATAAQIHAALTAEFKHQPIPSIRTIQACLARYRKSHEMALLHFHDPGKAQSRHRPAAGSTTEWVTEPNQLWEIDASPVDLICKDGIRLNLYALIDTHTRRLMLHLSSTARTEAMMELIQKTVRAWGLPQAIRTDNGKDFTSNWASRAFSLLEVTVHLTQPFSPWQKGMVERAIGTLQRDLVAILPGFTGHNIAQAQALRGRKTFAQRLGEDDKTLYQADLNQFELKDRLNHWAANSYGNRPHHGLDGRTPNQAAAGATARMIDDPSLAILTSKPIDGDQGLRAVGKRGIRYAGRFYHCPEAIAHSGQRVYVHESPDLGILNLFCPQTNALIGEAICPQLAGTSRKALAVAVQAEYQQQMKAARAELRKQARPYSPRKLADKVEQGYAQIAGLDNVVALPGRKQQAQLQAHIPDEAKEQTRLEQTRLEQTRLEQASLEQASLEQASLEQAAFDLDRTDLDRRAARIARAERILDALDRGKLVTPADQSWFDGYCKHPEWQAHFNTHHAQEEAL